MRAEIFISKKYQVPPPPPESQLVALLTVHYLPTNSVVDDKQQWPTFTGIYYNLYKQHEQYRTDTIVIIHKEITCYVFCICIHVLCSRVNSCLYVLFIFRVSHSYRLLLIFGRP